MFNQSVTSWWQVKKARVVFGWGRFKRMFFVGTMAFGLVMLFMCVSRYMPWLLD